MGIFSRLSDLIVANVNALLDKAENPERMLAQIIREMEEGLGTARQQAATAIALERRLTRELQHHQNESGHWKEQARLALTSNREDLARQALARKIEHDDLARGLSSQCSGAQETSSHVRAALRALELRLAEARRKQRTLLARHRAAKIRLEVQRAAVSVAPDAGTSFAKFARIEERLIDAEDHLLAQAEVTGPPSNLDTELAGLQADKRIEEELAQLKQEAAGSQITTTPAE
jgi:phage shock protein A